MTLTRRQLLKTGAAVVAVAGTPMLRGIPARAAGSAIAGSNTAPSRLTQAAFTAQVGTMFRVRATAAGNVDIRLDSVTSLQRPLPPAPAPTGEGFSLLFRGPVTKAFAQGQYALRHPHLGTFRFLLVPVGPAGKDRAYEAVVNRLW